MFKIMSINRCVFKVSIFLSLLVSPLAGQIVVESEDPEFSAFVNKELSLMAKGKRGLACQTMMENFESSSLSTIIRPLTRDDSTWHPNDRKGIRSHVEPQDFKIRGAARTQPTKAILYLHTSRINPKLSTFKLGTFVHQLAEALDLNLGQFSGDYKVREKRSSFYRNAWRSSFGFPLMKMTGNVTTDEYQLSKEFGLISEEKKSFFPILNPWKLSGKFEDVTNSDKLLFPLDKAEEKKIFYGEFSKGSYFLKVDKIKGDKVRLKYGRQEKGEFEIFEVDLTKSPITLSLPITEKGLETAEIQSGSRLVSSGSSKKSAENYSDAWRNEIPEVN